MAFHGIGLSIIEMVVPFFKHVTHYMFLQPLSVVFLLLCFIALLLATCFCTSNALAYLNLKLISSIVKLPSMKLYDKLINAQFVTRRFHNIPDIYPVVYAAVCFMENVCP